LAHGFNELVRTHGGARLEEWINSAVSGPFPEVRGFAQGGYGDFDAVNVGLPHEWSFGKVESNVTRVK
jgi:transposase